MQSFGQQPSLEKSPSVVYFRTCPRDYKCLTQALTTGLRDGISETCRDGSHDLVGFIELSNQTRQDHVASASNIQAGTLA